MTRKLLISLAINVPWAMVVFSNFYLTFFGRLTQDPPNALLFFVIALGSGAILGLTLRLYLPHTTRWTHILLLSLVWGVGLTSSYFNTLIFVIIPFFAVFITIRIVLSIMRDKVSIGLGCSLLWAPVICGVMFGFPMILWMNFSHNLTEWWFTGLIGALYAVSIHVFLMMTSDLMTPHTSPAKSMPPV